MTAVSVFDEHDEYGDDLTLDSIPHLSESEVMAIAAYVGALGERMGLADWAILISTVPPEDGALASINPTPNQRRAVLRVHPGTPKWPAELTRRVLVHELVHCHVEKMDDVYHDVADELGAQARRVSDRVWITALEQATDDIAEAWADAMPLIEWTPAGKVPTRKRRTNTA